MVKGSTPTFKLKLPVHSDIINTIEVIFVQENHSSLTVEGDRMTFDGYFVSFKLEDWETLEFAPGVIADLQLTLSTKDGDVYVSDIKKVAVRKKYPEDII
jgi:hypothetical protein